MNPNGQNGNNNSYNPNAQGGYQPVQSNVPQFETPQNLNQNYNQQQAAGYMGLPQNNPYAQTIQNVMNNPQQYIQQPMQPAQSMLPPQQMLPQQQTQAAAPKKKGHALEIVLIVFIFLIGAGAIAGAAYCQSEYSKLNQQVSSDRGIAIAEAKEAQKQIDDKAYEIRSASNLKEFTGPSDFGSLTFKYPKEWNIYLKNNDDSKPGYEAYFSPEYVPPTSGGYNFALSFKIVNQSYSNYMKKYENKKLSSTSAFSVNGLSGSKITGKLDEKAEQPDGTEVAIQVNNYTAVIRTDDYNLYAAEYDSIITDLASANY